VGRRLHGGPTAQPTIALCHEWLGARHGSEKTFEAMAAALPDADLYGLTWNRDAGLSFGGRTVSTTFLDRLGVLSGRRDLQLPLMPLAWRYASRRRYDVVVTSSHACAKGFWPAREAIQLCYCYTPMRYLWLSSIDRRHRWRRAGALPERLLRSWDRTSAKWVDEFAAISAVVQTRIAEHYGRSAVVIHPPVDTDYYTPGREKGGFALAVSRMVAYKRLDLAIRATHRVRMPLVVAGAGPLEDKLRALVAELGADVRFVSSPDDETLRTLYRSAEVLVFPAEEDFGIVPVEAQACGTPVVAYGAGGVLDTVVPGVTGVLVEAQDEDSFAAGIETALQRRFSATACRHNAERFSPTHFRQAFLDWVISSAEARGTTLTAPRASDAR
jgi:glycosyltransferase involved in cell wall biosynthesis